MAHNPEYTNGRLWDMVKEIDDKARDENFTDWELTFTADMMLRREDHRGYTPGQKEHILRLWEKYCA